MPAVGLVASLALSSIGTAATVGTAVLGAAGITASTVVANIVGGAIIGAGTGALTAAVTGGKPLKGALIGALSGGVGGGVTAGVGEALQGAGLSPSVASGISSGAGGFARGTVGALASGANLGQALKGGLISVISGGLGSGIGQEFGLGNVGTTLLTSGLSTGLQAALAPSASRSLQYGGGFTPQVTQQAKGVTTPSTGATIGGSLAAAPSGYVPGGAVFGTSDSDKKPSNVWNTASLRNIGEENA